jgi:hypothetical protein
MSELTTTENGLTIQHLQDPAVFAKVAEQVQTHVNKNGLTSNIKGKNYVEVEGWQFAGALLGIFPRMEELTNLSDGSKYKYRSRVVLVDMHTGRELGSGEAICSNQEKSKQYFDEYAIASMAQTRATGKAFRLFIGWIMKAAGFEATPAEDVETGEKGDSSNEPKWYMVRDQFKEFAIKAVSFCETADQIHQLVTIAGYLKNEPEFLDTARAQYAAMKDEIQ